MVLAKGTAAFISGPANLLNKAPKNPPELFYTTIYNMNIMI